jgi:RNA-directed DNA polymerase
VNWVLDADIRGFFDNLSHEWALKFVEHRVADRRILRQRPWQRLNLLLERWIQFPRVLHPYP